MNEGYYVDLNGETAGPFTIGELRGLFAGKTVTEETLYARKDSQSWLPLRTILPLLVDPAAPPKMKRSATWGDYLCQACGNIGSPKTKTNGSILIEMVLWGAGFLLGVMTGVLTLVFTLIPGLLYSLWRLTTRHKCCPTCEQRNIIPADSPVARESLDYDATAAKMGWGILVAIAAIVILAFWLAR